MAVLLTVTQGPDQGKSLTLEQGRTYKVGCDAADDLVLSDPMVLKGHCSLEVTPEGVILRNHTASAGTYIGEKKVSQARIPGKATFRIGDSALTLRPAPAATPEPATPAPAGDGRPRGGANDPLIGKIIGGYKLLEVVGRGGMGVVYKAVQLSLQREVALKVLARKLSKDKNFRDLFINEARAAAQLVHPNVVQVYDAGTEGDVTYFSMEFIGQGSVEEILARDKQIPWEEAILMVLEAAHGLEYAENKGIVHRDIKPDNLMLNNDGRIKIADLGLAKRGEGGPDQGIIGTPHFIPPEQALGKDVDTRADIYSLGATFFRMITGRTLFSGKTAKEIVLKHIKEPPPAASSLNSAIPDELDGVIAKMLAKEPDQRFDSATDLIHALETVCAHHGIKGAIIKKGVSKMVLVPLFLLLIGAGYAVYHFAMKDPVQLEDTKSKEDAAKARAAAAKARAAQDKLARQNRKNSLESDWNGLDGQYWRQGGDKGVYSHRDEQDGRENQREEKWLGWATRFDEFAERDDVKEFEDELGYGAKATAKAKWIRDTVDEVKKTVQDKQAKLNAAATAIDKIHKEKRAELDELMRLQKYTEAWSLADKLSREKPLPDDPFAKILAQEWVSPINDKVRQPFGEVDRLVKLVAEARKFHEGRKEDITTAATRDWSALKKRIPAADALAAATDSDLEEALGALKPVIDNFGSAQPAMRDATIQANSRYQAIQRELKNRARELQAGDRQAIKDTLRQHRSLSASVLPNTIMTADFPAARSAWQRLLDNGNVRTPRYQAFVRERIEALRYIEWLFARFQVDVRRTRLAGRAPNPSLNSLNSEFESDSGRKFSFRFDKPDDVDPQRFWMSKKYKGKDEMLFSSFGMDWVLECAFKEPGTAPDKLRWRDVTPIIRFSVALFCFETMQYDAAVTHFELLKDDPDYGPVAVFFGDRARVEAKALADYKALLKDYREADSAAKIEAVASALKNFGKQHAGTLFYIDVMSNSEQITVDVYPDPSDESARIPALKAAPEPPR
ncbi:MAG: protein kinase domain-containing protein [Planctomycetota bacterium]|jgi:hypothetical protein